MTAIPPLLTPSDDEPLEDLQQHSKYPPMDADLPPPLPETYLKPVRAGEVGPTKGKGRRTGKTGYALLTELQKRSWAVDLRKQGKTYAQIAKELACDLATARRLVREALTEYAEQLTETSEEILRLDLERLDRLYCILADRIEKTGTARDVEVALKVLERKSKLLGLDAPEKQQIKVELVDMPDEDLLSEAARLGLSVHITTVVPILLPGESPEARRSVIEYLPSSSAPSISATSEKVKANELLPAKLGPGETESGPASDNSGPSDSSETQQPVSP